MSSLIAKGGFFVDMLVPFLTPPDEILSSYVFAYTRTQLQWLPLMRVEIFPLFDFDVVHDETSQCCTKVLPHEYFETSQCLINFANLII